MSEEITFRYLNSEQQERFIFTLYQVLTGCGFTVSEKSQIERDLCQQFGLADIGHLRPEQVAEAQQWMVAAWMTEQLDRQLRQLYAQQGDMMKTVQTAYLLANRQKTLLVTLFRRATAALLTLVLMLQPAFPFRSVVQAAPRKATSLRFHPVTQAASEDGQVIAHPYAERSETDVLTRATATLEADPFPNVQDADLIVSAVNYAGNFSASAVVNRAFLEDCVDGFPMAALLKDSMRLDAAVLTEIPGTNYSPVMYLLATMNPAGDINKGPLLIYFGTLLGPKALLARTPSAAPSRVPTLGEDFGLLWHNAFSVVNEVAQRPGRGAVDDCVACLITVKANAKRSLDGKRLAAAAVATTAGLGCAAISVGVFAAICFAAAAAALIGTLKWIYAEYDEKIYNAKRGICAVNRETGQSCQWER